MDEIILMQKLWGVTYKDKDYVVYENFEPFNNHTKVYCDGEEVEDDNLCNEIFVFMKRQLFGEVVK